MPRASEARENHSDANMQALHDKMTIKTVKWFRPEDFQFNDEHTATCPGQAAR